MIEYFIIEMDTKSVSSQQNMEWYGSCLPLFRASMRKNLFAIYIFIWMMMVTSVILLGFGSIELFSCKIHGLKIKSHISDKIFITYVY